MDKKLELWAIIGLAVGGVIAVLFATRSSSGGVVSSGPSDAAVASIEAAGAQARNSANQLELGKTQAAAAAILGLAQSDNTTKVAAVNASTQLQESKVASTTTISTAQILADANEIIQSMVSQQANFATSVGGQNTATTTDAAVKVATSHDAAATAIAASGATAATAIGSANANAQIVASNNAKDAANTKSNDSLWGQIVGGITSIVPFL